MLGLQHPCREVNASFQPFPPPGRSPNGTSVIDGNGKVAPRRRLGPREPVALAAVAAVVWLAVHSGEGLPFRSSEPAAPATAGDVVRTRLAPNRLDLERQAAGPVVKAPTGKKGDRQRKREESTAPRVKDDGPPTGGGGDEDAKPLLEATLPGVGTVTVDEPDVPTVPDVEPAMLPALPDTGDVVPETVTAALP